MADLFSNPRFRAFRDKLAEKGLDLRMMWSANTGHYDPATGKRFRYDNLAMFVMVGTVNGKRPEIATLIVQDYGARDGFGLWTESTSVSIEADVEKIAA